MGDRVARRVLVRVDRALGWLVEADEVLRDEENPQLDGLVAHVAKARRELLIVREAIVAFIAAP